MQLLETYSVVHHIGHVSSLHAAPHRLLEEAVHWSSDQDRHIASAVTLRVDVRLHVHEGEWPVDGAAIRL
jgi:hypothetical protein